MPLNPDAVAQIPRPDGKINLNAGTLTPVPRPVQARADALRHAMGANPSDFCWRQTPALIQSSRQALAAYLNVKPDELLLVPNVTFAINLIVSSLTLLRGTEVLLTDHDYGAMTYTWQRWAAVRDWSLRTLQLPPLHDATPESILAAFDEAMTPSTRVLFLYHVTSPTGLVLPLKQICALAREREIVTVVDGAHAPGGLPLDLADIGADFYASNTHKWLMAPAHGGFLHVCRRRRTDVRPLITSWGWGYNRSEAFDDSKGGGSRWQWDLEFHGTTDRVAQMVLPEALAFRDALGGDAAIFARTAELGDYARRVIPAPLVPVPLAASAARPPITAFELPTATGDPAALRDRMYLEFGIECPITVAAGRHYLRVSHAVFSTEQDLDALARAVKAIWP